jgi:hypothetical protein
MDEAPENNSMFTRAGGGTKTNLKNTSVQSPAAQALLIENRWNFVQQLSKFQALKGAGRCFDRRVYRRKGNNGHNSAVEIYEQ